MKYAIQVTKYAYFRFYPNWFSCYGVFEPQTNKHNQKLVEKVQKLEIQFEKLLQFTANGIIIIKFQILPTQTIVCVYLLSFFMYDYCKFCYLIRR